MCTHKHKKCVNPTYKVSLHKLTWMTQRFGSLHSDKTELQLSSFKKMKIRMCLFFTSGYFRLYWVLSSPAGLRPSGRFTALKNITTIPYFNLLNPGGDLSIDDMI